MPANMTPRGYLRRGVDRVRHSLIAKLTVPPVLVVLFASLLSSQILGELFTSTHEASAEQHSEHFADAIVQEFQHAADPLHADVEPLLQLLCRTSDKVALITDRNYRVRFSCADDVRAGVAASPLRDGARVVHAGTDWVRRVRPISGGASCAACHGTLAPIGYLAVDAPLEGAEAEVREQKRMNLIGGAMLALVLSVMLVFVQVFLVYRPVRTLAKTVDRIRAGDRSVRLSTAAGDELAGLAQNLNEMAASIDHAEAELNRTHKAQLAQSEKLAALGQLLASVTHEIKNPLAGIIGALRVLESGAPPSDPNKAILGKILSQMERLSQTVVNALDFARPMEPAVVDVDIAELLDRTLFFVERQAAEQAVALHRRYVPDLAHAHVDPDLMKQVFLNLFLNAIQAMPHGGTLEIATRPVGTFAVEVIVSDQGLGIAPEHLEQIFSPFFSTKERGTGLGLYVARQILETQRGQISVESHPGQGTTFTLRIPAAPGTGKEQAHDAG